MSSKKKEKKSRITDAKEASRIICEYIIKQNRPYNATDIHSNLHDTIGKTLVTKTLAKLAADGKLLEKLNGKQKIYMPCQDQFDKLTPEEMADLEAKISTLKKDLADTTAQLAGLESKYKALNGQLTSAEARLQLQECTAELETVRERLHKLQSAENQVTPKEREKIVKKSALYVKEWRSRKRTANDMLDSILEGYNKKKKNLYEDIGIETDEEIGVSIKDFVVQ